MHEPKLLVCQTFGLLEAGGLTFIPMKVRLLLFGKYTYHFCFSFCEFAM